MAFDKFALLRQRRAAVEAAEARSTATTDVLSQRLDRLAALTPVAPEPVRPLAGVEKLEAKIAFANSAAGFAMRDLPYAEIDRICNMQIIAQMSKEELAAYQEANVLADARRSGWNLFDLQCEAGLAYDQFNGLFAPIGVGWGKCVSGSTEVFDSLLGRRRVDQLGSFRTPSMKDGQIRHESCVAFASGVKECMKLTLMDGRAVQLSLDHPVFTARGWVKAEGITSVDLVASARQIPPPQECLDISDDVVKIAAYMASDGGTTGMPVFTSMDGPVTKEVEEIAIRLGGGITERISKSRAREFTVRGIMPLIRRLGFDGCLSKNKRLPADFYLLDQRQMGLFINRFWACDGYMDRTRIETCLASEKMIDDLQFMLSMLGVRSMKAFKEASCSGKQFPAWRLTICGQLDIKRFLEVVGNIFGREQECLDLVNSFEGKAVNTNTDVVPISRKGISEIAVEMGLSKTEMRNLFGATEGQYIGRDKFFAFTSIMGYKGKYAWLATSDISWSRAKSIERTGIQQVFDLSVPETGNFVANGIVVHNTLITLMVANKAYAKGKRKILLCVPPNVLSQLTQTDIRFARTKIPFNVPVHIVGGKDALSRRSLTKSGKKGLYILPYSYLSVKDTEEMLNDIKPEVIICDEAHNLANRGSARTRRMMNYIDKHGPEGIVLSGTITSKSIRDYFHLIKWCLKGYNPLPNGLQLANEWAAVIDADATGIYGEGGSGRTAQSPLIPLIRWAQKHFGAIGNAFREDVPSFRRAYKLRMTTAPGVVSSGDASIATSLVIANQPIENKEQVPGWQKLDSLASKVTDEWLTPNGDEIEHAIHCWKWLNELWGAGFYNELVWPTPEKYAERKKISLDAATDILKKATDHHFAGQIYAKELRKWLQDESYQGCDTPLLVGHEMSRNGAKNVGAGLYDLWQDWRALDFEGRPERDSHAIRVCPYKINEAVKWAKGIEGGALIWVYHQEAGLWCYEELVKAGINALHCPAGDRFNESILDPANGRKIVVASMTAHGTGKNLQHFQNNYFLQWPRQAVAAEQTIGRTHRNGQKADELTVITNFTTEFDSLNFAACLNDSLYIHQTTGNRQKLIYAVYNPLPEIFPSAVLQERGLEPKMLTKDQAQLLKERFGG